MNYIQKTHQLSYQIISLLADGNCHSGELLGQKFKVSRAAIAKHMKQLAQFGLNVETIKGKGYQLSYPIELLDETYLQQHSQFPVTCFPILDSTNQYLLNQYQQFKINSSPAPLPLTKQTPNLPKGSVCVAEYQTHGRGRRGKTWVSPFAHNLNFSMYWRLESGVTNAMGLSLAVGVALAETLQQLGVFGAQLKWPNDLYHQGKKIGGILIEMSGQMGGAVHLVIGVGLNLKMQGKQQDIDQPWTSIEQICQNNAIKPLSRNQILIKMLQTCSQTLSEYEKQGIAPFIPKWNALDYFKDKPVTVWLEDRQTNGIAKGVNEQGALLLETSNGIQTFLGGEISLRLNSTRTAK